MQAEAEALLLEELHLRLQLVRARLRRHARRLLLGQRRAQRLRVVPPLGRGAAPAAARGVSRGGRGGGAAGAVGWMRVAQAAPLLPWPLLPWPPRGGPGAQLEQLAVRVLRDLLLLAQGGRQGLHLL